MQKKHMIIHYTKGIWTQKFLFSTLCVWNKRAFENESMISVVYTRRSGKSNWWIPRCINYTWFIWYTQHQQIGWFWMDFKSTRCEIVLTISIPCHRYVVLFLLLLLYLSIFNRFGSNNLFIFLDSRTCYVNTSI